MSDAPDAILDVLRSEIPHLRRFARTLVAHDAVDDVVQETTVRAWRYGTSYQATSTYRSWLFTICRRVALDHASRSARTAFATPGLFDDADAPSRGSDPARVELELLIEGLPDHERQAFVLPQLVGLRYEEAAEVETVPVGTIRSRVARARRLLMAELSDARAV